jgi:hypothetical protein
MYEKSPDFLVRIAILRFDTRMSNSQVEVHALTCSSARFILSLKLTERNSQRTLRNYLTASPFVFS